MVSHFQEKACSKCVRSREHVYVVVAGVDKVTISMFFYLQTASRSPVMAFYTLYAI